MTVTAEPRTQEALERFERFLHRKDLRLTEARAAIVEAALARQGHYPIEELIHDLKQRGIRGSKATVYRTLPLLAEAGILQPAIVAGDSKSYETTFGRQHHDHLLCMTCRRVVEFEFEAFEILQKEVATRYGFRLEGHHHELVGTCPDCLAKEAARASAAPAPKTASGAA
ncbi:Fur family transcriptional regulator [Anaeromyxobacter oryzae]|uniref:Ferric uptake regulation protein n=1 Tax=Anaeromyxobacter oryzae TaxID=2918170 RepID=A0ABM7WTC9_9BACT|nr:Fur family transcriptional regulator [Anaeromyxobacter oryzae]BDG02749.1 transcriptional repressor [Anaeromyxobacter oryzae]